MEDVLAAIAEIGDAGRVIVEQDIFPDPAEPPERPAADQVADREWLRARGIQPPGGGQQPGKGYLAGQRRQQPAG